MSRLQQKEVNTPSLLCVSLLGLLCPVCSFCDPLSKEQCSAEDF